MFMTARSVWAHPHSSRSIALSRAISSAFSISTPLLSRITGSITINQTYGLVSSTSANQSGSGYQKVLAGGCVPVNSSASITQFCTLFLGIGFVSKTLDGIPRAGVTKDRAVCCHPLDVISGDTVILAPGPPSAFAVFVFTGDFVSCQLLALLNLPACDLFEGECGGAFCVRVERGTFLGRGSFGVQAFLSCRVLEGSS